MDRARAARAAEDPDSTFILCWIAFNAAYARARKPHDAQREFEKYFRKLLQSDRDAVREAICRRFPDPVEKLVDNVFLFEKFWDQANERADGETETSPEWNDEFRCEGDTVRQALENSSKFDVRVLTILFRRLYTLRNQLVHGGATWGSKLNRYSVESGARIMEDLLPIFLRVMRENPNEDWGRPPYWAGLWQGPAGN